jgi:tripeptide aminopeptidase
MKTSALRRFLKYVTYDTRSDEQSSTFPSTPGQLVLLRDLVEELRALGLDDATMDDYGYVMATVTPTAGCGHAPAVGFIAHVDTSPEMPGHEVRPLVHERYDGGDIVMPDDP